ncbi:MAG TPA: hypothetical protein VFA43_21120, partial [Gemmatimonadaceae bacterium]|nr:hypothetical protein [Gemmatimonadaceae bacterium]
MRLLALGSLAFASLAMTADQRPITFDDFASVGAVSEPQISPDGRTVLYTVGTVDLAANKRSPATWRVGASGGSAHRFPDDTTKATEATWSPDGRRIAYIAGGQLWVATVEGGGPHKITSLTGEATGPKWSPDGSRLAFTSRVYPTCSDETCNAKTAKASEANPAKAHVADHLLYRHWNAWDDGTRAHLFVIPADGGTPADLTPSAPYDVPPGPFGGSEGYAWSPDGKELAFSAKDQGASDAWSTNVDVYTVPVSGGQITDITRDNHGADQNPVYSPDGRYIA